MTAVTTGALLAYFHYMTLTQGTSSAAMHALSVSLLHGSQGADTKVTTVQAGEAVVGTQVAGTEIVIPVPRTRAEIMQLRAMRSELSNQIESAEGRVDRLTSELAAAPPEARKGITERIDVLSARIVELESQIAASGKSLALGLQTTSTTSPPPFADMDSDLVGGIGLAFIMFVLAPIAFAVARRIWKRTTSKMVSTVQDSDGAQRLKRMEQAMDSVAIEVERISEGQRFLTNLFAEQRKREMLMDGAAVEAPRRDE